MPKVSAQSAHVEDVGILLDRSGELEGYTANFIIFRQDVDATPILKGLPDDRCQCPPSCPSGPYPRPHGRPVMHRLPKHVRTMPNPCAGVPRNPWCSGRRTP
jgi:hypothetical protein